MRSTGVHGGWRPGADQGSGRILFAAVILFLIGYWAGQRFASEDEADLMKRIEKAKRAEGLCREQKQEKGKVDTLRQELMAVSEKRERKEQEATDCEQQKFLLNNKLKEEQKELLKLQKEQQVAGQVFHSVANNTSAKMVVMLKVLDKLKAELNIHSKAELDTLVERWTAHQKRFNKEGSRRKFLTVQDQILPNARVLNVSVPPPMNIDSVEVSTDEKDDDGRWVVPSFELITGNREIKYGAQPKATPMESTLFKQLRLLTKYAVCAVGEGVPNLMFPERYRQCADAEKCPMIGLTNHVVTPLVQWCHHCVPVHNLESFNLLCGKLTLRDAFLRRVFWRARSRVRFADHHLDEADRYFREVLLGHSSAHVIGVLVPPPAPPGKKCAELKVRAPFEMLAKKTNPWKLELAPVSKVDSPAGCLPGWARIFEEVKKKVIALRKDQKPWRVFISCVHCTAEDWEAADQAAIQSYSPFRNSILRYDDDARSKIQHKIVDAVVLSWADELFLGRRDEMSLFVFEEYLLRKRFKPKFPVNVW